MTFDLKTITDSGVYPQVLELADSSYYPECGTTGWLSAYILPDGIRIISNKTFSFRLPAAVFKKMDEVDGVDEVDDVDDVDGVDEVDRVDLVNPVEMNRQFGGCVDRGDIADHAGQEPEFEIPIGFVSDLASVPAALKWYLHSIGAYTCAAFIHDYLYWSGACVALAGSSEGGKEMSDRALKYFAGLFGSSELECFNLYEGVRIGGQAAWDHYRALEAEAGVHF